jgi:hypothetical protein
MRLALAVLAVPLVAAPVLATVSAATQFVTQAPGYVYRPGVQGFGYYPVPAAAPAPAPAPGVVAAPAPAATRSTVGPGNRNWTTGNRVNLHRPWLRSRR